MLERYLQITKLLLSCPQYVRWLVAVLILAGCSMLTISILKQSGIFYEAELAMIQVLASHPFYMSAQEAQVNMMGEGANHWLCLGIALYFTPVLLRERRGGVQCLIVMLGLIALALASTCAVFFGGVLNLWAPMSCLFITWVITAAAGELRRLHQIILQHAQETKAQA